ncbi:MAG: zinc-binding dehydrogenase [Rhizobiaceae bacterium]|nr:zinc-binding dehydrogenase [Rhizobiaceae bacterium]
MKTIEISQHGGPEVLTNGTRDVPQAGPSQVLIKITAAGVNGPDIVQRRGHYPPPPGASDLLGLEVSGEIIALGESVESWAVGDKVCALTNGGGYAEYVAVEASHCLPIPHGVEELDAAGLPETLFTVWNNVFLNQNIKPGSLMLVHGGAGGIGSTAIQLGKAFGLRVFATSGKPEGCKFCEDMGAERAINYRDEDFVEIVKEAGGADIIVDIIGGDYIARNIKAANPDGRIIQLAFNKGSKVEVNLMPIMLKRLTYTGSTLRPRSKEFKAEIAADLKKQVWPLYAEGKIKSHTHATFPFEQVIEAHQMMEQAAHRGKILLTP